MVLASILSSIDAQRPASPNDIIATEAGNESDFNPGSASMKSQPYAAPIKIITVAIPLTTKPTAAGLQARFIGFSVTALIPFEF
ncbi:MAG TPA: hypothetical protein VF605_05610 [Allosphingosinicella sp.]